MTALPWQTIDKADKSKVLLLGRLDAPCWWKGLWVSNQWYALVGDLLVALEEQPTHFLDITPPGTAQEASAVTDDETLELAFEAAEEEMRARREMGVKIRACDVWNDIQAALRAAETKEPSR